MIQWMGHAFTASDYMFWTRIQCSAWTLADLILIFYLIRTANLARHVTGARPHRVSYVILLATVPPAAAIPFTTTGIGIFLIELLVTLPHFLLIGYVLLADARQCAAALAALLKR